MSTTLDHSVGLALESTWGVAVTPTRWYEWLADSEVSWDPEPKQGEGLRVGSVVDRAARRRAGLGIGEIQVQAELLSRSFGLLLHLCLGANTANLVSGTTNQQVFTLASTGMYLPSATIQCGIVDAGGVSRPHQFAGCQVKTWSLELPEDGLAKITATFDVPKPPDTATALTAPSMLAQTATSPTIYATRDVSAMTIGGTVTVPTATALAPGGTRYPAANWRSLTIEGDNGLGDRPGMGARNQATAGKRMITIGGELEYADNTLRDALVSQASVPITTTLTAPEPLSVGSAQLQLVVPASKVNSGAWPTPADGEVVVTDAELQVLDPLVAATAPLYIVLRTADSAI